MSDSSKDAELAPARTESVVRYTLGEALIDHVSGHPYWFALLFLLATGSISGVLKGGGPWVAFIAFAFWSVIVSFFAMTGALSRQDRERHRRELTDLERSLDEGYARHLAADPSADQEVSLTLFRKIRYGIRPAIRAKKIPLVFGSIALLVALLSGELVGVGLQGFLDIALPSLAFYTIFVLMILGKEILMPTREVEREVLANVRMRRLVARGEEKDLRGAISFEEGLASDEFTGGLSMSQEKGAISSADHDPED